MLWDCKFTSTVVLFYWSNGDFVSVCARWTAPTCICSRELFYFV